MGATRNSANTAQLPLFLLSKWCTRLRAVLSKMLPTRDAYNNSNDINGRQMQRQRTRDPEGESECFVEKCSQKILRQHGFVVAHVARSEG